LVAVVLPKHSVVFAELYPATKKEEKFPIKLHSVESKTQKIPDSSLKKVQTSTQNINAPQNVMTLNPSVFQVSRRMMTSEYAIPQPSVTSAQRLMMSYCLRVVGARLGVALVGSNAFDSYSWEVEHLELN
jgi:hypothetical protein